MSLVSGSLVLALDKGNHYSMIKYAEVDARVDDRDTWERGHIPSPA